MTRNASPSALLTTLHEALDLLLDHDPGPYDKGDGNTGDGLEPLDSLVAQCSALVENAPADPPIRMIHHFACTGGTLISKLISATANTVLLSEVDPLSRLMIGNGRNPIFAPTDLIYNARVALRPVDDHVAVEMFQASLTVLQAHLQKSGQNLVIRDHSHSHFCTNEDPEARPTLRALVQQVTPVRSVVTIRHPLDSFLSLERNGWHHFSPFTLEEYARRYLLFVEQYRDVAMIRYEDIVAEPEPWTEKICEELALPFRPGLDAMLSITPMSGDSGRKASTIGSRSRRAISPDIQKQIVSSPSYEQLCCALGYDARVSLGQ